MMWFWLSALIVLLGAELNAEMEHQTERDTTRGHEQPMGRARRLRRRHRGRATTEPGLTAGRSAPSSAAMPRYRPFLDGPVASRHGAESAGSRRVDRDRRALRCRSRAAPRAARAAPRRGLRRPAGEPRRAGRGAGAAARAPARPLPRPLSPRRRRDRQPGHRRALRARRPGPRRRSSSPGGWCRRISACCSGALRAIGWWRRCCASRRTGGSPTSSAGRSSRSTSRCRASASAWRRPSTGSSPICGRAAGVAGELEPGRHATSASCRPSTARPAADRAGARRRAAVAARRAPDVPPPAALGRRAVRHPHLSSSRSPAAIDGAAAALALAARIGEMPDAMARYKGIAPIREPLLAWLAQRARQGPSAGG